MNLSSQPAMGHAGFVLGFVAGLLASWAALRAHHYLGQPVEPVVVGSPSLPSLPDWWFDEDIDTSEASASDFYD